ncbi:MAG: twin-arginine translocase subunit TatC, partial [Chloroflexota bacterium]
MRADDRHPLAAHFSELRSRAIRSVLFFILATAVALAFHRLLLQALLLPAEDLNAFTDGKPIFTELTEFWGAALKVSLLAGLGLSLPFILFQIVRFAAPGLREQERRWLWFLIPGGLLAFATGVLFGYFVLIPPAINFLSTFGGEIATPIIRIGSYVNLVTSLLFWLGLVFELPLVIFFLAKIGVVTSSWLASKRKWAILLAF